MVVSPAVEMHYKDKMSEESKCCVSFILEQWFCSCGLLDIRALKLIRQICFQVCFHLFVRMRACVRANMCGFKHACVCIKWER